MKLPSRPQRQNGESALGFLMRLGEAHGVKESHVIANDIGMNWFDLIRGRNLRPLSTATATELSNLSFDTAQPMPGGVRLRGEFLRRKHWTLRRGRRCCPECFRDDGAQASSRLPRRWHRTWWDIQVVSVCPTHKLPLVSSCGQCGETLSFRTCYIGCCSNGHSVETRREGTVDEYAGDAYVVGRIAGTHRNENSLLDTGTLAEAIDCMELVGAKALQHSTNDKPAPHQILHTGFQILSDWPLAFHTFLDQCAELSESRPGRWGASATYGSLHAGLYEIGDGPISQAIKHEIRSHAARNGLCLSKPVFGAKGCSTRFITVKDAAGRLKMAPESARKLLATKDLIPDETKRGTPIRVDVQDVDRIAATRSQGFGVKQFAANLAIGRMQARELAKVLYGPDRRLFTVSDVDGILEQMKILAHPQISATDALALPKACQVGRCKLWFAVDAIRKGQLKPIRCDKGMGLSRIVVRLSDIQRLGKSKRSHHSVADVASSLRIKWQVARDLTQLGLIRSSQGGIQKSEIDNFRKTFVSASAVAQASGNHPNFVNKALVDAGVLPAAAPPHCRQVFYRRSDLATRRSPVFARSVAHTA